MSTQIDQILGRREDPYERADRDSARRWAGALWLVQSAALVAIAPLTPPTEALGASVGWAALAAMVASGLAVGWLLLRGRSLREYRLRLEYLAVAEIALFAWLAGDTAITALILVWVVIVPGYRPLRQVVPFLVFVALAVLTPLAYMDWDRSQDAGMAVRLAAWGMLAALVIVRVRDFRSQRAELERTGREAMQLAVTDPLTGLANRRAFDQVVRREVALVNRNPRPLTLVLADLDGFKEINDRHGHVNGDDYLRRVAETISAVLREGDAGFRWGGDEFALLLPDTDRKQAERVCERVGSLVTATMAATVEVEMTLSFGLAEHEPGMSPEDLVEAADLELMAGKV